LSTQARNLARLTFCPRLGCSGPSVQRQYYGVAAEF